jgi:hypothetical protein
MSRRQPRRTAKYTAGVKLAQQKSITRARTHDRLYEALEAAGWLWDPNMGKDGGWFRRREVATVRPPAKPTTPPPDTSRDPLRFLGSPAHVDLLIVRITTLEARVKTLEQTVNLLQSSGAARQAVGELFGIDLVGAS